MHLDCSRQPLEGNNQSVFTVQSAGAETSSTNYSKRVARLSEMLSFAYDNCQ